MQVFHHSTVHERLIRCRMTVKALGEYAIEVNFSLERIGLQRRCGYARFDKYCCKLSKAIAISSVRSCDPRHQAI
jgi:hypothetical protein